VFNDCCADLLGSLTIDLGHHCKTAFSFYQSDDGMLTPRTNAGIGLLTLDARATLNRVKSIRYRAPARGQAASVMTAERISVAARSLAAQALRFPRTIPALTRASHQFPVDSRFVTSQYLGHPDLGSSNAYHCTYLIMLGLDEVCTGHPAASTGRSKCFDANAPQPTGPLIKSCTSSFESSL
jgi:hypothetical protein